MNLNFVNQYKAIFDLKKNHEMIHKQIYPKKQILMVISICITVSVLVGWLFNLLSNFNYVFLMINAIGIASYVIYLISLNKNIQYEEKITYPLWPVIIVEVSQFFVPMLIWQTLIYVLYLNFTGMLFILLFFSILSLVAIIITDQVHKDDEHYMIRVFYRSISFASIQVGLIFLNPIRGLVPNFIMSLCAVMIYNYLIHLGYKKIYFKKTLKFVFYYVFFWGFILTMFLVFDKDYRNIFSYAIKGNEQTIIDLQNEETPFLATTYSPYRFVYEENFYYISEYAQDMFGNVIHHYVSIYDIEGNNVDRIEMPHPSALVIPSNKGIYVSVSTTEDNLVNGLPVDSEDEKFSYLFQLTDQYTFEKMIQLSSDTIFDFVYEDSSGFYLFHEDRVAYYNELTDLLEWKDMTTLGDVFVDLDNYFYIVEQNNIFTNMFRNIGHPMNRLPFWNQIIYVYRDGYALSYQGNEWGRDIVLIDVEHHKVIETDLFQYLSTKFAVINDYQFLDFSSRNLLIDLRKDQSYLIFESPIKDYYLQEGHLLISRESPTIIKIVDLDKGYTIHQMVNEIDFDLDFFIILSAIYVGMFVFTRTYKKE
jgi:hypothetical protein